ncbi:UreD-domain-containing protein [Serendipita vermifera]|nr:UreD-domain-containing protein [Serendipita vermifera]
MANPVRTTSIGPLRKAVHGKGRAELRVFGDNAHFSELSYTYPLKLLSPRSTTAASNEAAQRVAILYSLSYGGGLISGDRIELSLDVKEAAKLVLLTQGSTKIFPARPDQRLSSGIAEGNPKDSNARQTVQRMSAHVDSSAFLVLLPDPVTPFQGAAYSQTQIFRLAAPSKGKPGASLLLLDWFTSGRAARGEEWQFDRYRSANEVWIGNKRVACDVLLLDQSERHDPRSPEATAPSNQSHPAKKRRLRISLAPYSCYATVLMFGPATRDLANQLHKRYDSLTQMQRRTPESLIWSFSPLEDGEGCIVRVAGTNTEMVRRWLRDSLRGLETQLGKDAYSKAFV